MTTTEKAITSFKATKLIQVNNQSGKLNQFNFNQFLLQSDASANPERSLPKLPGVQLVKDSSSRKSQGLVTQDTKQIRHKQYLRAK